MNKKNVIALAILLVVTFSLSSCAGGMVTIYTRIKVSIPEDFQLASGEVKDKIPLRAGLSLSPDLVNFSYEGLELGKVHPTTYFVGDALRSGSERMLRNIFQDVTVIGYLDTISEKNVDVVVVPQVTSLSQEFKVLPGDTHKELVMYLVIKWNIVTPDGKNIYTNTIRGEALAKTIISWSISTHEKKSIERMISVLQDEFRRAQEDIYTSTWWKNLWWKNKT